MMDYRIFDIDFRIPYRIEPSNYGCRDEYTFYSANDQRETISYHNYMDI